MTAKAPPRDRAPAKWIAYSSAVGAVSVSAFLGAFVVGRTELADVVMVFLLGIVVVALALGRGPSVLATGLSVVTYDFFFVPPYGSFYVHNPRHFVTFGVMFWVAIVISGLMTRVRAQAQAAEEREIRTAVLYDLSRDLARAPVTDAVVSAASRHIEEVFACGVAVLLSHEGALLPVHATEGLGPRLAQESAIADQAFRTHAPCGLGTGRFADSDGLYLPLVASQGVVGVLAVFPTSRLRFAHLDERHELHSFAAQTAAAIERARLAEQSEARRVQVEAEQLRNALLSSVSHDLRTPLAVIAGATSTLLHEGQPVPEAERRSLLTSVYDEADRLNRLIDNLLDMTRLEAGIVQVKKEWYPIDEVIGVAIRRAEPRLAGREVRVRADPDVMAPMDGLLVEQALVNLFENAGKYTPPGAAIDVTVRASEKKLFIDLADRGPGLAPGEEERIFQKFYRSKRDSARALGGSGLGLTIARAIATAHGGELSAKPREGGGTVFSLVLPIDGEPPGV